MTYAVSKNPDGTLKVVNTRTGRIFSHAVSHDVASRQLRALGLSYRKKLQFK